jgi:hypothetical protein
MIKLVNEVYPIQKYIILSESKRMYLFHDLYKEITIFNLNNKKDGKYKLKVI